MYAHVAREYWYMMADASVLNFSRNSLARASVSCWALRPGVNSATTSSNITAAPATTLPVVDISAGKFTRETLEPEEHFWFSPKNLWGRLAGRCLQLVCDLPNPAEVKE